MKNNSKSRLGKVLIALLALTALLFGKTLPAEAVRVKELANVKGVRNNQLVGYGVIVGLSGTGDGKKSAFTNQGLVNMMNNLGVQVTKDDVDVKNVASVMVTAQLPPFVKKGQPIDVTVSALGDASSLQGGTLIATQLKGLDGKVYAMAQGSVSIGGFEVQGETTGRQKNHLTVARIPGGATVEKEVPVSFNDQETITLSLKSPDFTTVSRLVQAVNNHLGGSFASATDGATVEVQVPSSFRTNQVGLLAALESLEVNPDTVAKVILDERTGTVVMGENVRVGQVALSHGKLSLQITGQPVEPNKVAQPATPSRLVLIPGTTLGEVVRALNAIGVTPRDMIAIFQSIKAAGALQADLEII